MAQASRDENSVPTLLGVSNVDGTTPITVYVDPVTHRLLVDITSGGFSELTAIGDVNSSNVTFTFTQVPSYIVADGIWLKPTDNNGGVQWSNVGLTVTMVNPPSFSIFGIA